MTSTDVNHHIGCGTPANVTTLRDIAHLLEQVANGYLGAERDTFYELMRNDYEGSGYAEGELWPIMQAEASAAGLTPTEFAAFRDDYYMAFKKGGYEVGNLFYRCWGGWVRMPFYANGGVDLREYLVGSFVAEGSSEANAIAAAKFAAAEVLRDELRAALRTYRGYVPGTFTTFGAACAGSNGTPAHSASGVPEIGQSAIYRLENAPLRAPVVLHFGLSSTSWNGLPLPFDLGVLNAAGCAIRTDVIAAVPLTASIFGGISVTVPVPLDPQLVGGLVFSQFLVLDPRANRLGLTTSEGLRTRIGGRP